MTTKKVPPTPVVPTKKPWPLTPLFARYWPLIVIFVGSIFLALNDWMFKLLGQLIYLPLLAIGSALSALLIRNLIFSSTSEADVDSGWFTAEWKKLDPALRVTLTVAIVLTLFLGCAWIAAAMI